jgi:hypothetical protein
MQLSLLSSQPITLLRTEALRVRVATRLLCAIAAAGGSGLVAAAAHAQSGAGVHVSIEGVTDLRKRGLSWSHGKPAATSSATLPVSYNLLVDMEAATLRDSARHGGADLGLTIGPRYTIEAGGWGLTAGARGNIFIGRGGMSYVELVGEAEHTLGPAKLVIGADFAPSQSAIGGHNLHLTADMSVGIPGLPLTIYGGIGHTSGSDDGKPRATRLRPGGSYWNHQVGVERSRGALAFGVSYTGTSIAADQVDKFSPYYDRHHGSRVLGYMRLTP